MEFLEGIIESERERTVKRSVDFVQNSSYPMTLQQLRLLIYCMSQVQKGDNVNKMYEIDLKKFIQVCGLSRSNYNATKKLIVETFCNSILELETFDENGKKAYTILSWFTEMTVTESGILRFRFSPRVAESLIEIAEQPEKESRLFYISDAIKYMLPFRSRYSYYLYPLLRSYQNRKEWTFSIKELKKRLDAEDDDQVSSEMRKYLKDTGVKRKKYKNFAQFRENVLDPAVRDINEFSNIKIAYRTNAGGGVGREITSVTFIFEDKTDAEKIDSESRGKCILEGGKGDTELLIAAASPVPDPLKFHEVMNTGDDTHPQSITVSDKETEHEGMTVGEDGSLEYAAGYEVSLGKRKRRKDTQNAALETTETPDDENENSV